ncbi:MAG: Eco57I restriction-modification methylase domain-containing protein, partial [Candidatus Kapaibacteriales bacterium]
MDKVKFPDDEEKDKEKRNAKNLIRMITRIIFIWFMKAQKLIPSEIFDKQFIDKILNYKDKTGSTYYKAILQNLFFATLNTPMKNEKNKNEAPSRIFVDEAQKRGYISDGYLQHGFYRYKRFIKDVDTFLKTFENIPFLNGGLFDCLDKKVDGKEIRIDCFSDNPKNETRLKVPDELFFLNYEKTVDLSNYLEKGTNKKVTGLFEILNKYNFTIDENTPIDQEVALDPELLGKVFENLLAAYVPETATTARKATGSYYTPREIVDYMVDESLTEYLTQRMIEGARSYVDIGKTQTDMFGNEGRKGQLEIIEKLDPKRWLDNEEKLKPEIKKLLSYEDETTEFNDEDKKILIKAIEDIKILDPACGSGAFPMGILHKLVLALHKLDPENKIWKEQLIKKAAPEIREELKQSLENKPLDYIRKLGLIEHCIYGVDIQEIAIQISKLRFFISLLVEQVPDDTKPNRDIKSLPNLETKFVAANSLISIEKPKQLEIKNSEVEQLENELFKVREEIFYSNSRWEKVELQKKEKKLREKLKKALKESGFKNTVAEQITSWDPFDQNTHA